MTPVEQGRALSLDGQALPEVVLPLNMVDNSTHPFQTHFGPVYGHEAVPTGHFTLE